MMKYDELVTNIKNENSKCHDMDNTLYEIQDLPKIESRIKNILSIATPLSSGYGPKTVNAVVAFDTETTNALSSEDKRPFIYSFAFTIQSILTGENINIHCSTMDDFKKIIKYLSQVSKCFVSNKIKTKKDHDTRIEDNHYTENGTDDHNNYDDSNDIYLNVYVHNLPFDYSFLMDAFNIRTIFCSDSHHPYYVLTWDGIKFVDTVVLTQKTLEQLGKGLTQFNIKKQVGDLDYNKIRTSETTFSDKEKGYIVSDTMVLSAYMTELCRTDYDYRLCDIPLTQTGKVRNYIKGLCNGNRSSVRELLDEGFVFTKFCNDKYNNNDLEKANDILKDDCCDLKSKEWAKNVFTSFKKKISQTYKNNIRKKLTIDSFDDYLQFKRTYSGGYTHANAAYSCLTMKNVASFDFTSSYPTIICSEEFPMSMYIKPSYTNKKFISLLKTTNKDHRMYFFRAEIDGLELNHEISPDTFLSGSKMYTKIDDNYKRVDQLNDIDSQRAGVIEDNGRIFKINHCVVYLTSIDWETISKVYYFDNVNFSRIMEFKTAYLPPQIIMAVLHFYEQKTTLKHVKGREHDYMLYKEQLNSIYGMTVQDPVNDIITYHNNHHEWTVDQDDDIDAAIEKYNTSPARFLWYPWGIAITAFARRNLWTGILACNKDYIYSDTDSIKIRNKNKHMKYIKTYNKLITAKIKKVCKFYDIPFDKANPVDIDGNHHQLGIWDADDGYYSYFKTLGAKRYIDISKDNGNFECTIAGLPKRKGTEWMINQSNIGHDGTKITSNNIDKLFDLFNDNMTVPSKDSGKLTHTYIDEYDSFSITDYQGHVTHIDSGMGCFLEPASFTLSLSKKYLNFIIYYTNNYIRKELNGYME